MRVIGIPKPVGQPLGHAAIDHLAGFSDSQEALSTRRMAHLLAAAEARLIAVPRGSKDSNQLKLPSTFGFTMRRSSRFLSLLC
jgi:hypothetical protein